MMTIPYPYNPHHVSLPSISSSMEALVVKQTQQKQTQQKQKTKTKNKKQKT